MAEPEGYVRTFVEEGPRIGEILSAALDACRRDRLDPTVSAHQLVKLLTALERDGANTVSSVADLPEPLSEREREVLQLNADGKTNRTIAADLFGTVKTHLRNLYRKLEAQSRTQAVARARELNLI